MAALYCWWRAPESRTRPECESVKVSALLEAHLSCLCTDTNRQTDTQTHLHGHNLHLHIVGSVALPLSSLSLALYIYHHQPTATRNHHHHKATRDSQPRRTRATLVELEGRLLRDQKQLLQDHSSGGSASTKCSKTETHLSR